MDNYLQHRMNKKLGLVTDPPKERKAIPKVSEKRKAQIEEDKKVSALDKEFYADLWAASPHTCFECGRQLGREPLTIFFHHLLAKSAFPEFRHTPENIAIVCPDHHAQAETYLDKVPRIKRRRGEVYKELIG